MEENNISIHKLIVYVSTPSKTVELAGKYLIKYVYCYTNTYLYSSHLVICLVIKLIHGLAGAASQLIIYSYVSCTPADVCELQLHS